MNNKTKANHCAYNLGKFLYYVYTCGVEDIPVPIPYEKGSTEYHNFDVGHSDAFIEQSRFYLETGHTKPSYVAMCFGIQDYEQFLIPKPNDEV